MELFKATVSIDDSGKIFIVDGREYQDSVWIVAKWLNYPTEGNRTPERTIRLQKDETQHTTNSSIFLYSAKYPLPASLLSA